MASRAPCLDIGFRRATRNTLRVLAMPAASSMLLLAWVAADTRMGRASFEQDVAPFLQQHCVSCHGGLSPTASLDLEQFQTEAQALAQPQVWETVRRKLSTGQMPPAGKPRPRSQDVDRVLAWIGATQPPSSPGRTTLRRLNRVEYANTVRDLLGADFAGTDDFPSDDIGYGFDNIGDVLTISPLLFEKYFQAAQQLATAAIPVPGDTVVFADSSQLAIEGAGSVQSGSVMLYSAGQAVTEGDFATLGDYTVEVRASGQQAGPEACRAAVCIDGKPIAEFKVDAPAKSPALYKKTVSISPGRHKIGVAFLNDYYNPAAVDPSQRDRNLLVQSIKIVAPREIDTLKLSPSARKVLFRRIRSEDDVRLILERFAQRAYRRPVTAKELAALMKVAGLAKASNEPLERGVRLGVVAALVSPNFLFRPELDPKGAKGKRALSSWEVASKLSYFLWSTMPDDQLFDKARSGVLLQPEVLKAEVKRMLVSSRSNALAENFASQWLTLRKLDTASTDTKQFPEFDQAMRADMATETKLFFDNLIRQDESLMDLVVGKYSFLNSRLAALYGVPNVQGEAFRRVSLKGTPRSGVITHASVLTVTSNPTRTSPVKRGKWLLENLLGTPTPPPPPGVGTLAEDAAAQQPKTLRARLEAHRAKPECASCHAKLDPLGFGLENFDPIGRWRTAVQGEAIDAGGTLPDGKTFVGPEQLAMVLSGKRDLIVRNLAEKLLTYALGRGVEAYDSAAISDIARQLETGGYKMSSMVQAIVLSDPFLNRMPEGVKP